MVRFLSNLLIVCIVSALPGCHPRVENLGSAAHINLSRPLSVLIVSIDALHPDALNQSSTKNIDSLMENGVFTLDGHSTNPPLTLLSHAAMFTGIGPDEGGRTNNFWKLGEKKVPVATIFNDAKSRGFSTGFFYAKAKLGYLVSEDIDAHQLDRDFTVELAESFFESDEPKKFCFLHISGLDRVGPTEGWLSTGYMEELYFIDKSLMPLIEQVTSQPGYLIIITSDHAGHGIVHGSNHPDDSKLPLVVVSDTVDLGSYQGIRFHVTDLRPMLKKILGL
jgi:predicted AlkP superfamily pyrophosphatase or phosphodiesterase